MAASSSTSLPFYRLTDLSNHHHHHKPHPCHYSHHLLFRPLLPYLLTTSNKRSRSGSNSVISCRISGVDGSGVSDEFLSTNSFYREFSVIANMLKKIEPLDVSVISKGASDSVKDSMKRMINSMLGLIQSEQFSVTITVSKRPLVRLLASSLITGYTLWNAEYRIMLMKNFETSGINMTTRLNSGGCDDDVKDKSEEKDEVCDDNVEMEYCAEELERLNLESCLGDLSSDAVNYIRELESELSAAEKDLHTQKQEAMQIGHATGSNNDILKYLRSLDSDMLDELSRPSSSEVKGILQQLVQSTSRRVFKEDITSSLIGDFCETRDYFVKLLFWCMLLGHQLRGLENTLYLRCAVGFS